MSSRMAALMAPTTDRPRTAAVSSVAPGQRHLGQRGVGLRAPRRVAGNATVSSFASSAARTATSSSSSSPRSAPRRAASRAQPGEISHRAAGPAAGGLRSARSKRSRIPAASPRPRGPAARARTPAGGPAAASARRRRPGRRGRASVRPRRRRRGRGAPSPSRPPPGTRAAVAQSLGRPVGLRAARHGKVGDDLGPGEHMHAVEPSGASAAARSLSLVSVRHPRRQPPDLLDPLGGVRSHVDVAARSRRTPWR